MVSRAESAIMKESGVSAKAFQVAIMQHQNSLVLQQAFMAMQVSSETANT